MVVQEALNRLFAHDAFLLTNDVSEWAVAHRLAVYLEQLLPGWNVDCEYNRQGQDRDPKSDQYGTILRPDIAVHHRGYCEREHNLLVIEVKKGDSTQDASKAREYTGRAAGDRRFQYSHGLTLVIGNPVALTWYQDGRKARR
jgi:hypothetical protein